MLILTRLGINDSLGLMSLRSLFERVRVLSWFSPKREGGSSCNLLLWRSNTERLGAFSRVVIDAMKLNERVRVSNLVDCGTELNA